MSEIKNKIRSFIEENFLFRDDGPELGDSESLLDAGVIDSTGVLELVAFLEAEFAISMADADIVPANLDSIKAIVGYVERKTAKQVAA